MHTAPQLSLMLAFLPPSAVQRCSASSISCSGLTHSVRAGTTIPVPSLAGSEHDRANTIVKVLPRLSDLRPYRMGTFTRCSPARLSLFWRHAQRTGQQSQYREPTISMPRRMEDSIPCCLDG